MNLKWDINVVICEKSFSRRSLTDQEFCQRPGLSLKMLGPNSKSSLFLVTNKLLYMFADTVTPV